MKPRFTAANIKLQSIVFSVVQSPKSPFPSGLHQMALQADVLATRVALPKQYSRLQRSRLIAPRNFIVECLGAFLIRLRHVSAALPAPHSLRKFRLQLISFDAQVLMYSSYANICPDTDPALIGLNTYTDQLVKGLPNGFNSCATTLKTYDCVRDFQYDAPSSGKLYGPADLPAKGTKSLSNTPGEVTAPVSGATFSWTAAGSVWTVTAASANGKAATTTGSKTTTAGTSSGTSSVAPTTTPNYGSQTSFQSTLAFAAAIVAMLACY